MSSKIQLAGQKYRDKTALAAKRDSAAFVSVFKAGAFLNLTYLNVGSNPVEVPKCQFHVNLQLFKLQRPLPRLYHNLDFEFPQFTPSLF